MNHVFYCDDSAKAGLELGVSVDVPGRADRRIALSIRFTDNSQAMGIFISEAEAIRLAQFLLEYAPSPLARLALQAE